MAQKNVDEILKLIARKVYEINTLLGSVNATSEDSKAKVSTLLGDVANLKSQVQQLQTDSASSLTEVRVNQLIDEKVSALTEGADEALNTFKEIGDKLKLGDTAAQAVLEQVAQLKTKDTELQSDLDAVKEFVAFAKKDVLFSQIQSILTTGQEE